LELAVTRHHHDAAGAAGEPARARHPIRLREAHAERPGVGRDERRRDDVGMTGQPAEPAEPVQEIEVQLAERDQQRVERGRVVPLRRKVRVGVRRAAVHIGQLLGPQPRDEIGGAEAGADVARSCLHDHVERVEAADVGEQPGPRNRIVGRPAHRRNRRERHVREPAVSGELLVRVIFFTHGLRRTQSLRRPQSKLFFFASFAAFAFHRCRVNHQP
jgi:hypothetical protein